MSGWASLSGYLYIKPGGGGLSLLKTRKRLWCVLEESQGRLLYFKNEDDARSKAPIGYIEIRGAAITLDMDSHNQFIIIVDGKEIQLTAENHESMMIWMMALQARRDQFALAEKSRTSSTSTENDLDLDLNFLEVVESRERSASDLSIVRCVSDVVKPSSQPLQPRGHKPLEATHSLQESALSHLHSGSRQLSMSMRAQRMPRDDVIWSNASSSSTDNSDDLYMDSGIQAMSSCITDQDNVSATGSTHEESGEATSKDGGRVSELEKELIATKCELAKVLNKQSCFQEILKQKDEIIEDLDEKLGNKSFNNEVYDSKKRATAANKEHQERVRVLQNQNRFLNEEVRRLAKLRGQEHDKIKLQESKVKKLEADIEVWKLEYISLIQSSIRFTGTDTMDDAELSLYGGDRHKNRIISLLDEARKINPSLPTFELLSRGEVHVDTYGFKHHFSDEGLLLHYLCQELSQHFLCQASSYEKHQRNWLQHLKTNSKNILANRKTLKTLVRNGIPDVHRKHVWKAFVLAQVEDIIIEKGAHYFRSLCNAVPDSPLAARYRKQISLDLMRTMPTNVKFSTQGCKGIMDLQDVLLAFCIHNPQVGYCQGMNFLVAMALLFMDAQDAFWALVAVTERYHSPSYFDHNLLGAQADQAVLRDLMSEKLPELAKHLDAIDIEISTVTLNWFLALFFDAVPFPTLLRIWDCFLLEGPKVLFRFSLAILQLHSREIIMKCDTISVMRHLKACAKITYDVDGLVMVAFKTLKPFSRRQDIVSKQTCYLNALKEKYKWRDIQRVTYAERENVYLSLECDADKYTGFECCTVTKSGEAWVAYSDPPNVKICIVDCKEQTMTDTNITFDTRVLSMIYGNDDMVLMGTLSWFVFAYSQPTRELLWQQRLHDAVLSMQLYQDEEGDQMFRLFAGLADGTIAVFEAVNSKCTSYDLFYLPVGQSPVTCLQLLSNKLWCACGNNVSIINASTLDPKDRFTVSTNPYDTILSLVPGLPGVWISVRGSSVLELWDSENITCKMLYDTRTGKFPNLRKEDETYFNAARITSILSMDYSVWVGTGEGILITFDVFTQGQKTPSESSSYVAETFLSGDLELQSWRSESQKGDVENTARLVEVQKRVNEIFLQRQNADTDSSIFQNVEVIDVDSSSSYLELELDGMDCNLKTQKVTDFTNLALNSRENLIDKNSDDQFNQMGFLPNCKGNSKLDFISKMDLSKKFSADSTETDISVKTNTSGISSNYSHHNDLSGHVSIDSVSLHDSGYVQPISPSRHKDQVVNIPSSESQPFEEATSCGDAHFASQHIHTSTFDSPGHSLKQNDTGSLQEFHEKRSSRKSADSGISSLHEKCCQSQEQHKKSDSFVDQQSSEFGNEAEQNTEVKNNLLNSSENVAVDLISPYNSDVVSEVNNIDNPHNDTNIQFDLPNGRSVSLDSNKTTDSDEVFTDLCVPNVSDISLTADRDLCDQDNLTQEHIKEKYLQSDSSSLDKQGEDSPLENQFNSNFNRPVNDVNKRDKNTKSQHLFSAYTETQGEQIKPNSFLRRVQSLKKNFKVDQNLNSKKVSQKSSNVLVSVNQPDLSHSDLVKEPEAVIELSDVQDINHNFTSSSSISKGLTVSTNLSDSSLNSASDLSNGTCTDETSKMEENSLDSTVDTLKLGSQQIQRPNEASTTLYSDCNDAFPEALSSTISMFPCSQDSALKNVESQNAENVVKGIDTKFYGDSDEDSRVHEARVQSFKDSYKRMSSANLKFKLLHDVIPENANGPVIKTLLTSRLSDGRENPSSASSETNSRSSDIASSYFPNSNSLKKPLAAIGRQNSDASIVLGNVQSKDPYAQWRLDYTNIHVDTDIDSSVISSASNDGQGGEGDSCPPSRRLSCISGGSDLKDQRLKQFLRDTASSFSSQMGNSSEDDKRMTFLLTPNMSGCNSASWSSYDEISTTSQDNDSVKYRMPRPSAFHMESRATSIASTIDLYAGGTDLTLLSKNKISDKPVKWLLSTHSEGRPVILSFSGSHSDDEAVLLWSREVKETLWTNAPIFIYNPTTKRATLPSYMRPQLAGSARTSPRIKITSHNEA